MQITIDENSADQRFDRFLRKYCKNHPDVKLGDIFLWVRKGLVRVNGKKTKENYRIQLGDVVMFRDDIFLGAKNPHLLISKKDEKIKQIDKKMLKKMIVQEDDNWLIFNKPAGVILHPSSKHANDLTMQDYLMAVNGQQEVEKLKSGNLDDLRSLPSQGGQEKRQGGQIEEGGQEERQGGQGNVQVGQEEKQVGREEKQRGQENAQEGQTEEVNQTFKPSFCFRLDKDTSGVLIAGKTYKSLKYLNEKIRNREVEKYYLTMVAGTCPEYIRINKPLEKIYNKKFDRGQVVVKSTGKESLSEMWNIQTIDHKLLGKISFVKIKIHTGRMHQIRVHLESEGFPILGDIIYGNPALNRILYKSLKINRQLLHCWKYSFWSTIEEEKKSFVAPIPDDFVKLGCNKHKIQ